MTLNTEVSVKVVNIPDSNTSVELFIHDIAGHEVFLEYSTKYCEGASVFIIVFDVTNPDSFASASRWLQIAKRTRLTKGTHGVLVANKIDLDARRIISTQQGEEFAKANKLMYFECSAANNQEVDAPFYYLSNWFYGILHR
ncbi:Intraflagellar transport protein 27, partial [Rhizoclosmatium hyalinum]